MVQLSRTSGSVQLSRTSGAVQRARTSKVAQLSRTSEAAWRARTSGWGGAVVSDEWGGAAGSDECDTRGLDGPLSLHMPDFLPPFVGLVNINFPSVDVTVLLYAVAVCCNNLL